MDNGDIQNKYIFNKDINKIFDKNKKIVFILENPKDIELLTYLKNIITDNLCIVAVSPAVTWELEKKSIPHKLLNEYFDISRECKIGLGNFYILNEICEEIDSSFSKISPTINTFSFAASKNFFCYIKNFYDGIIFRIHVLKTIIDTEKPDIIVTVKEKNNLFFDKGESLFYPFSQNDSIYSSILDLDGWLCESIQIVRKSPEKSETKIKSGHLLQRCFSNLTQNNDDFYSFKLMVNAMGFRRALPIFYWTIINICKGNRKLIFTSYSRDWQKLLPEIYRNGYCVSFFHNQKKEKSNNIKLIPFNLKKNRINKYCIQEGIDFSLLFIEKISQLLNHFAYRFVDYLPYANKVIQNNNPIACIGGVDTCFDEIFFVKIAQHQNIPKITWQHGAVGFFEHPIIVFEELINSDFYFVYGEGVIEMCRKYPVDTQCKVIPIGSYALEELCKLKITSCKESSKNTTILYGTSCYYRNHLYFGYDHRLDDIALWHTQRNILSFLGKINQSVFLKLNPGEEEDYQIKEFISANKFHNISVYKTERNFSKLLEEADIIILDCPSTMLLEAIAAHKTVFLLLDFVKIPEEVKKSLEKRVYCSENIEELKDLVQKFLNSNPTNQAPDINNMEFLELYGIHTGEKRISDRVNDILENLN